MSLAVRLLLLASIFVLAWGGGSFAGWYTGLGRVTQALLAVVSVNALAISVVFNAPTGKSFAVAIAAVLLSATCSAGALGYGFNSPREFADPLPFVLEGLAYHAVAVSILQGLLCRRAFKGEARRLFYTTWGVSLIGSFVVGYVTTFSPEQPLPEADFQNASAADQNMQKLLAAGLRNYALMKGSLPRAQTVRQMLADIEPFAQGFSDPDWRTAIRYGRWAVPEHYVIPIEWNRAVAGRHIESLKPSEWIVKWRTLDESTVLVANEGMIGKSP